MKKPKYYDSDAPAVKYAPSYKHVQKALEVIGHNLGLLVELLQKPSKKNVIRKS